jgi:hypothetical protein
LAQGRNDFLIPQHPLPLVFFTWGNDERLITSAARNPYESNASQGRGMLISQFLMFLSLPVCFGFFVGWPFSEFTASV